MDTRYDQTLRASKNQDKSVTFVLAAETHYTSEDCVLVCKVVEVDKYDILVRIGEGNEVWIKKSAIFTTEIQS